MKNNKNNESSNFDLPKFTIKQLLESGAHFGHKTMRRNPKMSKYIYGNKNNISIIDLDKTAKLLNRSLEIVKNIAQNNGKILFVATKKQACDTVALAAKRCGQYYVNYRWLGGMLTNWNTVSKSIKTLKKIEDDLASNEVGLNKKEKLDLERKRLKLEKSLGGIKDMQGKPDLVFIIDINKESIALMESVKLNIPIMAIIDTNCNTDNITFPIPGNDDSTKSIKLFCKLISDAAISGMKEAMHKSGLDISKIDDEKIAQNKNSNTINDDLVKKVSSSELKKSLEKVKKNNDESLI
jgi:small subunit ribosomal protein S2